MDGSGFTLDINQPWENHGYLNSIYKSGEEDIVFNDHRNIVPLLHSFVKEFLRVRYMFWVNQEPYFSLDVIPCFTSENN